MQIAFDRVWDEDGIEHSPTEPHHRWTDGQAERINRTHKIAEVATIEKSDSDFTETLRGHVPLFAVTRGSIK